MEAIKRDKRVLNSNYSERQNDIHHCLLPNHLLFLHHHLSRKHRKEMHSHLHQNQNQCVEQPNSVLPNGPNHPGPGPEGIPMGDVSPDMRVTWILRSDVTDRLEVKPPPYKPELRQNTDRHKTFSEAELQN